MLDDYDDEPIPYCLVCNVTFTTAEREITRWEMLPDGTWIESSPYHKPCAAEPVATEPTRDQYDEPEPAE